MTDEPILDAPDLQHDDERRLTSGIKVKDAVAMAAIWWAAIGQKEMRSARLSGNPGASTFNPNPTTDQEALNSFPSGIMMAKSWPDLSRDEKLRVVKIWHQSIYLNKIPKSRQAPAPGKAIH